MSQTSHTKHTVSTDALDTLGNLIDETASRDAIHLAVEPIMADHSLFPGIHVGITDEGKASRYVSPHVGIVDPFLKEMVRKDERFWLIVYPRQITSLRHVWTHPAFDAVLTSTITVPDQPEADTDEDDLSCCC